MPHPLIVALILWLTPCLALAQGAGFTAFGGGGGGSSILMTDRGIATYSNGGCLNIVDGQTTFNLACSNADSRKYVAKATTITGWAVWIGDAMTSTSACTFTLVTTAGDVTTLPKPMVGDQDVANRTRLGAVGATFYQALSVSLAAGDWFQLRGDDEPTGSVGNDGVCSGWNVGNTFIEIYGK